MLARPLPAKEIETRVKDLSEAGVGVNKFSMRAQRDMQDAEDRRKTQRTEAGELLAVGDKERERGRRTVHEGKTKFRTWVGHRGGVPDIGKLLAIHSFTLFLPFDSRISLASFRSSG